MKNVTIFIPKAGIFMKNGCETQPEEHKRQAFFAVCLGVGLM